MKYEVQDHGNGFMIKRKRHNLLTWPKYKGVTPDEARKVLTEYIGKKKARKHAFARPMQFEGRSACWLTTAPFEYPDGSAVRSASDLRGAERSPMP